MVTVKLFGVLRLEAGVKELRLEAGSVKELIPLVCREIRRQRPDCAVSEKDLRACLAAVNGVRVNPRAKLRDGDMVVFFPAAAGGALTRRGGSPKRAIKSAAVRSASGCRRRARSAVTPFPARL